MFFCYRHQGKRRGFPAGIMKYRMTMISFLSMSCHSNDRHHNENDIKLVGGTDKGKNINTVVLVALALDYTSDSKEFRPVKYIYVPTL